MPQMAIRQHYACLYETRLWEMRIGCLRHGEGIGREVCLDGLNLCSTGMQRFSWSSDMSSHGYLLKASNLQPRTLVMGIAHCMLSIHFAAQCNAVSENAERALFLSNRFVSFHKKKRSPLPCLPEK
jgi:hypothetical protein